MGSCVELVYICGISVYQFSTQVVASALGLECSGNSGCLLCPGSIWQMQQLAAYGYGQPGMAPPEFAPQLQYLQSAVAQSPAQLAQQAKAATPGNSVLMEILKASVQDLPQGGGHVAPGEKTLNPKSYSKAAAPGNSVLMEIPKASVQDLPQGEGPCRSG